MDTRYEALHALQMPTQPPLAEASQAELVMPIAIANTIDSTLATAAELGISTPAVVDEPLRTGLRGALHNLIRRQARSETSAIEVSKNNSRRRIARIAGAIVVTVGLAQLLPNSSAQESQGNESTGAIIEEDIIVNPEDICPDGIFPDGKYEANRDVIANELHERPATALSGGAEFTDYFFGASPGPGVACRSAATAAVLTAGVNDILGSGRLNGQGFETTDIADLQRHFAYNTSRAEENIHLLADVFSQGGMNSEPIDGAFFRAAQREGAGNKPRVVFVEEPLDVDINKVFVLSASNFSGDTFTAIDREQLIVITPDGNIYFRKAIGARIAEDQQEEQDNNGAEEEGPNNGGGGGSGNGAGEGPGHNGDTRGCDGSCGTGSSGGGSGGGGGCGGGCGGGGNGGGGGGGTTPTTTRPNTTTTTRPNTTTTQQPPATTTTTQRPNSTTSTTQWHEDPNQGPPSGAGQ